MSITGLLSTELALASGCAVLDDERLAAVFDGILSRSTLDWDRFLKLAIYHGVDRLACARLEALRPGVLPDKLRCAIQPQSLAAAALHASQARVSVRTLAALHESGVPALVLKGSGVAHLLYPEHPDFRTSWDIDVLVAPENFRTAERALLNIGMHRTWPVAEPPAAAMPMLLTLANVFDFREPTLGHTVELHCRATMNPHALIIPFEKFHGSSVEVPTSDGGLRTLDGAINVAYLCHHATTSVVFRLKWFGDIARAERRAGGRDCARFVASDPGRLPQRPAQLVSRILRYLEWAAELSLAKTTVSADISKPLGRVLALMEERAYVPPARNLRRLPFDYANLRFVLCLLPGWRAKAYECLRFVSDPRDALTLRLAPRFAWVYGIIGPVLALHRYAVRKGRRGSE